MRNNTECMVVLAAQLSDTQKCGERENVYSIWLHNDTLFLSKKIYLQLSLCEGK